MLQWPADEYCRDAIRILAAGTFDIDRHGPRLELRHLRYFVAVAEELSFTRAAERLHIAQPPLSTQVRQLEEELGAQLFVRDKRRVYLTQPGREMLERARAILAATAEAKEAV